jgi:predicted nucleic acid-binding protein
MIVLLDTAPLWGLCNKHDQYHRQSSDFFRVLKKQGAELVVPRIAYVELMGHLTSALESRPQRALAPGKAASFLKQFSAYRFIWADQEAADYERADRLWAKFADWPIDYPDTLIAITAQRIRADKLWTFDFEFIRFLSSAFPDMRPIRDRIPE